MIDENYLKTPFLKDNKNRYATVKDMVKMTHRANISSLNIKILHLELSYLNCKKTWNILKDVMCVCGESITYSVARIRIHKPCK